MAHFVDIKLDIRFGIYREDEFDGHAMQIHNTVRGGQNPNAGLFPMGSASASSAGPPEVVSPEDTEYLSTEEVE